MNGDGDPSVEVDPLVVDQRLRNRIAESLEWLAEGADGVTHMSAAEYINQFFDQVDDEMTYRQGNTAMTDDEVVAVQRVLDVMLAVCAATPGAVEDSDLIGSPALPGSWRSRPRRSRRSTHAVVSTRRSSSRRCIVTSAEIGV